MRPWLSVIMPTFNGAAFLREALESVVAQRDEEIEVIAVDDGSTDETLAMLGAYQQVLPLTIVRQPHRGNCAANTARGKDVGGWRCPLPRPGRDLAPLEVLERLFVQCFIDTPATRPCPAGVGVALLRGRRIFFLSHPDRIYL